MPKKSQTNAVAKTSASSPAKSLGKAKPAKARTAPLSIALAKKTSPVRLASRTLRTVDRRTRAKAKPLSAINWENSLREQSYAEPSAERLHKTVLHKTTGDLQSRTALPAATKMPQQEPRANAAVSASMDGEMPKDLASMDVTTEGAMTKPFEGVRETIEAIRITGPEGAARQGAETMLHAGSMTCNPLAMLVRQQALGFTLMLYMLQIQRGLLDMWRPRHR